MREHNHHSSETAACEAADCQSGKRNRFFRGKALGKETFTVEQSYFIDRRRLLNRAVHGWGVVFGFALKLCERKVEVGAGLALDEVGHEILLAHCRELKPSQVMVLSHQDGECCLDRHAELSAGRWILAVHYAERPIESVKLTAGCGCDKTEHNYICETLVFSLRPAEERCPCGEPLCPQCHCCQDSCGSKARGPHSCLCHWSTSLDLSDGGGPLCEWQAYKVALCNRVDLACVTIDRNEDDECNPWYFRCIDDACGPRRLVKRNDLLYDLLRGCDLTRIEWISWGEWHRREDPVDWQEFEKRLHENDAAGFTVRFTGPVRIATLTTDCFAMSAYFPVEDSGWYAAFRVPLDQLKFAARGNDDPEGTTREVGIVVSQAWYHDEVCSHHVKFRDGPTTIEIEVRGDLIHDCNGQAVDANSNAFALSEDPVLIGAAIPIPKRGGNGTPGGSFLSVFRVNKKPDMPAEQRTRLSAT